MSLTDLAQTKTVNKQLTKRETEAAAVKAAVAVEASGIPTRAVLRVILVLLSVLVVL